MCSRLLANIYLFIFSMCLVLLAGPAAVCGCVGVWGDGQVFFFGDCSFVKFVAILDRGV